MLGMVLITKKWKKKSIQVLKEQKNTNYFEDLDATVKFITYYMNNAFDLLNNTFTFSIRPYNEPILFETFNTYRATS